MKSISQVAQLTGVSIRTLQYYDEIGLLKPSALTESGYRLYDDDALAHSPSPDIACMMTMRCGPCSRSCFSKNWDFN